MGRQFHNERDECGATNAYGQRTRTKGAIIDESHGRRAWRTNKELGRWTKSMDKMTEEDENASMDIVRAAAGISDSR